MPLHVSAYTQSSNIERAPVPSVGCVDCTALQINNYNYCKNQMTNNPFISCIAIYEILRPKHTPPLPSSTRVKVKAPWVHKTGNI